jgi:hypothetical protein
MSLVATIKCGYTLGGMASNPAATPPGERPPVDQEQAQEQLERYGPLTLARTRKDDGRRLILYSHSHSQGHSQGDREQS